MSVIVAMALQMDREMPFFYTYNLGLLAIQQLRRFNGS